MENYQSNLRELTELINQSAQKKESFFRHVQLLSVSVLGILAALNQNANESLYIRLTFVALILSLSLSILTASIVVFDYSNLAERTRQAYHAELGKAIQEDRNIDSLMINPLKRTLFCTKCSYVLWIMSVVLLASYSIVATF